MGEKEIYDMSSAEVRVALRETRQRMKAWRNAFFVSIGMFLVLVVELIFDFV